MLPNRIADVSSIFAIYSANDRALQRIFIPSFDDAEIYQQPVAPGERVVVLPISVFPVGAPLAVGVDRVRLALEGHR